MDTFSCGLAVALALAAGGSPATPPRAMETVLQDDALLLHRPPEQVRASVRTMAAMGVDRVRITAGWSALAPAPRSARRPAFDASTSLDYPRAGFAALDRAVRLVDAAGMAPMLDIAFFVPRWASQSRPPAGRGRSWDPSVREYRLFARAVADRYSGRFRDLRDGRGPLPQVRLWSTWNEPNNSTFLTPQWRTERVPAAGAERRAARGGRARPRPRSAVRRRLPYAPHLYRALHNAAYHELKRQSPSNQVLLGNLASFANPGRDATSNIGPLRFTRELACVDSNLRPLDRPACNGYEPLRADGFAHHPYSLATAPEEISAGGDRVQIGELGRLTSLLENLAESGRLARRLPLYLTEYGYETSPPDPKGRPETEVGAFLGRATYLAWRRGDVRMFPQFLLRDIAPDPRLSDDDPARWSDYQTGLLTADGSPKPDVVRGFEMPVRATALSGPRRGPEVAFFGQIRPGTGPQVVEIQRRTPEGRWVTAPSAPTDGGERCSVAATDLEGFYARRLTYEGEASYRAVLRRPARGRVSHSVAVAVSDPVGTVAGGAAAALTPGP